MTSINVFISTFFVQTVQLVDTTKIVKETAIELIYQYGQITTMEIKNHLRLNGYRITQKEVSIITQSLAKEYGFQWTCNGLYRTYFLTA